MRVSIVMLSALVTLSRAHDDPREAHAGIPQLIGARQFLSELKARNALREGYSVEQREQSHPVPVPDQEANLEARQSNDRCGPNLGTCIASECCSFEGYCGTGIDYCSAPDCQYKYGPKCDANQIPAGASTATIARPLLGSVEYGGVGIYDCVVPGDIAFTFDDGPYLYTSDLLDKLKVYNAKATFFITGNNLGKGPIDSTAQWSTLIKRMVTEGHQVASHTWSHQDLVTLDATHFQQQMIYNEMAFRNILGYFPTYMRPPYSSCNSACNAKLKTLGYHVTYFDLDTAGYLNDSPDLIQNSKNIWDAAINPSRPATDSFLEIEHDIHYQTVYNLTDYILASMYSHGYKSVTVGDCLGDPAAYWYRAGDGTTPNPPTTTSTPPTTTPTAPGGQTISTDGPCSATITCQGSTFGNCCSQYGYCGSTTDYCGTGCQLGSGSCGSSSSISKSTSSTKTSTSSTKNSSTSSTKPPTSSSKLSTRSSTTVPTSTRTSTSIQVATSKAQAQAISTSGKCSSNLTCNGSTFGNCCSQYGYCGTTTAYCGTGCQPAFGTCT